MYHAIIIIIYSVQLSYSGSYIIYSCRIINLFSIIIRNLVGVHVIYNISYLYNVAIIFSSKFLVFFLLFSTVNNSFIKQLFKTFFKKTSRIDLLLSLTYNM